MPAVNDRLKCAFLESRRITINLFRRLMPVTPIGGRVMILRFSPMGSFVVLSQVTGLAKILKDYFI